MYQFKSIDDTIVAISTAPGVGGIGIIRLSGKSALAVADKIFKGKGKQKASGFKTHTVHHGWIIERSSFKYEMIDEVLLTVFRSPKSYTKEDVVEVSCHGGAVVLNRILNLAVKAGARLAEPGEFTKRAFLNGRLDLTQAEAVLDIIQAKTESFLRVSTYQLKGELSQELESIRAELMNIFTEIEAVVNFPEDEIDASERKIIENKCSRVLKRVKKLLDSSQDGRILKEGIKIVLCGRPNVGKSSLLNCLLKQPRAIVSSISGTTRDTIEETAQIKGIPFQVVDTAGILEPRDFIEEEAVKRSRQSIEAADLILFIIDSSQRLSPDDFELLDSIKKRNVIIVFNKADLKTVAAKEEFRGALAYPLIIHVSALTKKGIDDLEKNILTVVMHGRQMNDHGLMVSSIRHVQSLRNCLDCLHRAEEHFVQQLSWEFVSEEIKQAVNELDSITGRNIDQDLLDKIFSQFCIGK